MRGKPVERRLAAILAADVAGYSRLMGADEEGTHERLKAHFEQLVDPQIKEHRGRTVKNTGDGLLSEFASVVDAVRCAVEIQRVMAERNVDLRADNRIEFRIGINLGDIIVDKGDIFGDGVNVASRLEALAQPGGICVSRVVRDQVRDRLEIVLEDMGEHQVKNIVRPVHAYRIVLGATRAAEAQDPAVLLALPDKPSIAVLPFQNLSGEPEQEYFVDAMVEEIITALSRIRWLFVIARNSSFTYKGQRVDVKQVGRELGVRYVLEGSVRKAGNRVRISGQLIDALTGTHLWADRFDGSLEHVFDLQDRVAISVAGVIEPALQAAEMRRSIARTTTDLTVYDLYLRAIALYFPVKKERVVEALGLLERAIAIDPHYGPALSWAAMCEMRLVFDGWAEDAETSRHNGVDLARRALQDAQNDPGVLANAAFALAVFNEDIGAMIGLIDRALALNPSFARGWSMSGALRILAGQPDLAIEHLETSLRLSPRERMAHPLSTIGLAYFLKRRFDEAVGKLRLAIQEEPGFANAYRTLAACYAHLGRLDEAREVIATLRTITPLIVPTHLPLRNPKDRELLLSGLRLAAAEPPTIAMHDKPSIAVLPFQNLSGDPEQEYFVDGMVEEIITALSRIPRLFVLARNSSFTYKDQVVNDVKQVGHELAVRYVLEGSVRKAGDRVRISGQLIDAATGTHLWADRFDGSLRDVFGLGLLSRRERYVSKMNDRLPQLFGEPGDLPRAAIARIRPRLLSVQRLYLAQGLSGDLRMIR